MLLIEKFATIVSQIISHCFWELNEIQIGFCDLLPIVSIIDKILNL